jgi:hypothetical protein
MQSTVALLLAIPVVLVVLGIAVRLWGETPDHPAHPPIPTKRFWKAVAYLAFAAAVGVGLIFFGVGLWSAHGYGTPRADRWLNVMTGLGATSAFLGFVGAVYFSARYGRRASVTLSAKPYLAPDAVILSVRPVVKAVGLFRVRFHGPRGAVVHVTEMYLAAPEETAGRGIKEGRSWEHAALFGEGEDKQFAEAGEELGTSALFRLPLASPSTIGWSVSLRISAPTRWLPGSSGAWADRVFVPRPEEDG